MAVLELYEQGDFEIDEEFKDLPDHVAVELEFLYLLIFNQCQARASGNVNDLVATQALQRRFLGEHLGAWISHFTEAVKAGAETGFYRELAGFTERFVQMQRSSLHDA